MNLPRSSYYYRPKAPETTSEQRVLTDRIEEIAEEFPRYGYRKVTAQLRREGLFVNHKKIQRIMGERGLGVKRRRRFLRTTNSDHPYPVYPNLIKHQGVTGVNQVCVADLTYIRIKMAFVYLAVILDLNSRKAIGYALFGSDRHGLSLTALHHQASPFVALSQEDKKDLHLLPVLFNVTDVVDQEHVIL